MAEFFFVLKTAIFSALVLLALQLKVGGMTLEEHTERRIYHSRVGAEMKEVARGAVHAGHDGWAWVKFQTRDKVAPLLEDDSSQTKRERSVRSRPRNDDLD